MPNTHRFEACQVTGSRLETVVVESISQVTETAGGIVWLLCFINSTRLLLPDSICSIKGAKTINEDRVLFASLPAGLNLKDQ